MKKNFGTPEQLKELVEDRIAELGGAEVESATNTVNVTGEPILGIDDEDNDQYFDALEGKVKTLVDFLTGGYSWKVRDDSITISIPTEDIIHVADVPLADLSKDMSHVDEDAEYIYIIF